MISAVAVAGLAAAGITYGTLHAGHMLADHVFQTNHQATQKGNQPDGTAEGRRAVRVAQWACARHCLVHMATYAVMLAVVALVLGLELPPVRTGLALVVLGLTHYIADRRVYLRRAAEWYKPGFWDLGSIAPCGSGAYSIDQSWHYVWIWAATLIIAA